METLAFSLLGLVAIMLTVAYRYDLKHWALKAWYGSRDYYQWKKIWYGEYHDFLEGCYNLQNNRMARKLTTREKRAIKKIAIRKKWYDCFKNDIPEYKKESFLLS